MLDIRNQLLQETSRFNMEYIASVIGDDKEKFAELMKLYLKEKDPIPAKAAWVAEYVCLKHPELIDPYLEDLVHSLALFTHPGSRRNSLKILMQTKIPEDLQGPLIDICFQWMSSTEKTVAVKVYAMQIIENHLELYPELAFELKSIIEDQWDKNSAGFKARGSKVLKRLEKFY